MSNRTWTCSCCGRRRLVKPITGDLVPIGPDGAAVQLYDFALLCLHCDNPEDRP